MPAPPKQPTNFIEILEQVWWRLDVALDEEMIRWSAMLGAVEALMSGTTGIIDHHEGPSAIDGSLSIIADACAEVGVRVNCAYGVTDRHGSSEATRGLAENERYLRAGGRGMVGVHAAFTCKDETLEAAAGLAADLGVGVHIHVAEALADRDAGARLESLAADDWLLVHCVHLDRALARHHRPQPAIEHEQLGGLRGADDAVESRRAGHRRNRGRHARGGPPRVHASPRTRCRRRVPTSCGRGSRRATASSPSVATIASSSTTTMPTARGTRRSLPGVRAVNVTLGSGEVVLRDGQPTRVDLDEVRAKSAEQAARLFAKL